MTLAPSRPIDRSLMRPDRVEPQGPPPPTTVTTTIVVIALITISATFAYVVTRSDPLAPSPVLSLAPQFVVWSEERTLHVYDMQNGRDAVLERSTDVATDAARPFASVAHGQLRWFEGDRTAAILRAIPVDALFGDDPDAEVETLVSFDGWLQAVGSSRDGRLAVLLASDEQQQRVEVWGTSGEPLERNPPRTVIWRFPPYLGRGLSPDDATTLAWSRDGMRLLVVNTFVDTADTRGDETLLVLAADGRARTVRQGTHGVWIADNEIAYQPYRGDGDGSWLVLDAASGSEHELGMRLPDAAAPAVSPDRTQLAIERWDADEVLIRDLNAGIERRVSGGAPQWLDNDRLLVSEMASCEDVIGDGCPDRRLLPTGRIRIVDLTAPGDVGFFDELPGIGRPTISSSEITVTHRLVAR